MTAEGVLVETSVKVSDLTTNEGRYHVHVTHENGIKYFSLFWMPGATGSSKGFTVTTTAKLIEIDLADKTP